MSAVKGVARGSKYAFRDRPPPHEGTDLRLYYDAFLAGKAVKAVKAVPDTFGKVRAELYRYHGFEFEKESKGVYRARGRQLVGGWVPIVPVAEIVEL